MPETFLQSELTEISRLLLEMCQKHNIVCVYCSLGRITNATTSGLTMVNFRGYSDEQSKKINLEILFEEYE